MRAVQAFALALCLAGPFVLTACGGATPEAQAPEAPEAEAPEAEEEAQAPEAPLTIIIRNAEYLFTYDGLDAERIRKPANLTLNNFVSAAGNETYDPLIVATVPHSTYTDWEDLSGRTLPDWDGISMVRGRGCRPCGSSRSNTSIMDAGYLKYSAFYLFEKEFRGPDPGLMREDTNDNVVAAEMFSYSIGPVTGKNPEFNATWEGGMIGKVEMGYFREAGNLLTGDATISVGMGGSSRDRVSVRLSKITDSVTGARHSSLSWNLPLRNGEFHYENETIDDLIGDIRGSFYGAGHQEVGGVFEGILENNRRMTGAFGAKRQ